MDERQDYVQELKIPSLFCTECKCTAKKSQITSSTESKCSDGQSINDKMSLLERSLEEQRTANEHLREDRDEQIAMNRFLMQEVEEVRKESYRGERHPYAEQQPRKENILYNKGLEEDKSLITYILALPRKFTLALVNRAVLFVWWSGSWANEGLRILSIENKWVALQKEQTRLEEENYRLREDNQELQQMLTEKEVQIAKQLERNGDVLWRFGGRCGVYNGSEQKFEKLSKNVQAIKTFTEGLSEEIERMKETMDRWLGRFDKVYYEIGRLSERKEKTSNSEQNADVRTQSSNQTTARACNCCTIESSDAQGKDVTRADIARGSSEPSKENASKGQTGEKSSTKETHIASKRKSRYCRFSCCTCKSVVLFIVTFLMTGIVLHFSLVAASPSIPLKWVTNFTGMVCTHCGPIL